MRTLVLLRVCYFKFRPILPDCTTFTNHSCFFLRYGHLAGRGTISQEDRELCSAVLTRIFGDSSALYQIGISKVSALAKYVLNIIIDV